MKRNFCLLLIVLILSFSMAFADLISIPTRPPVTYSDDFPDVTKDYWAYEPIMKMRAYGIINGYADGNFKPEGNVTRAEFAKILVNTLGVDVQKTGYKNVFADVSDNHWAVKYIAAASNYLTGYLDGEKLLYKPDTYATRDDIAVAVVIASGLKDKKFNSETIYNFEDYEDISEEIRNYISIAVENKIISGFPDGTFRPSELLTRAQVCQLMVNLIDVVGEIQRPEICTHENVVTKYSVVSDKGHRKETYCSKCGEVIARDTILAHTFNSANQCIVCGYINAKQFSDVKYIAETGVLDLGANYKNYCYTWNKNSTDTQEDLINNLKEHSNVFYYPAQRMLNYYYGENTNNELLGGAGNTRFSGKGTVVIADKNDISKNITVKVSDPFSGVKYDKNLDDLVLDDDSKYRMFKGSIQGDSYVPIPWGSSSSATDGLPAWLNKKAEGVKFSEYVKGDYVIIALKSNPASTKLIFIGDRADEVLFDDVKFDAKTLTIDLGENWDKYYFCSYPRKSVEEYELGVKENTVYVPGQRVLAHTTSSEHLTKKVTYDWDSNISTNEFTVVLKDDFTKTKTISYPTPFFIKEEIQEGNKEKFNIVVKGANYVESISTYWTGYKTFNSRSRRAAMGTNYSQNTPFTIKIEVPFKGVGTLNVTINDEYGNKYTFNKVWSTYTKEDFLGTWYLQEEYMSENHTMDSRLIIEKNKINFVGSHYYDFKGTYKIQNTRIIATLDTYSSMVSKEQKVNPQIIEFRLENNGKIIALTTPEVIEYINDKGVKATRDLDLEDGYIFEKRSPSGDNYTAPITTSKPTTTPIPTRPTATPKPTLAPVDTEKPKIVGGSATIKKNEKLTTSKFKVSDNVGVTSLKVITKPTHGSVTNLRVDGTFTYTPNKDYIGVDSFNVVVSDKAGNRSATATFTISIVDDENTPKPTGASTTVKIPTATPKATIPEGHNGVGMHEKDTSSGAISDPSIQSHYYPCKVAGCKYRYDVVSCIGTSWAVGAEPVDENGHKFLMKCSLCGYTSLSQNLSSHKMDSDGTCVNCKYKCQHLQASNWQYDSVIHWKECLVCKKQIVVEKHEIVGEKCNTCGFNYKSEAPQGHNGGGIHEKNSSSNLVFDSSTKSHYYPCKVPGCKYKYNLQKCSIKTNTTCKKIDNKNHKFTETCYYCNSVVSELTGAHNWKSNGICTYCGATCSHSLNASTGICNICGYAPTTPKTTTKPTATPKPIKTTGVPTTTHTHTYTAATCTMPSRCTICGATRGSALGHKWVDQGSVVVNNSNTHTFRQVCARCGANQMGKTEAHTFNSNGKCTKCGYTRAGLTTSKPTTTPIPTRPTATPKPSTPGVDEIKVPAGEAKRFASKLTKGGWFSIEVPNEKPIVGNYWQDGILFELYQNETESHEALMNQFRPEAENDNEMTMYGVNAWAKDLGFTLSTIPENAQVKLSYKLNGITYYDIAMVKNEHAEFEVVKNFVCFIFNNNKSIKINKWSKVSTTNQIESLYKKLGSEYLTINCFGKTIQLRQGNINNKNGIQYIANTPGKGGGSGYITRFDDPFSAEKAFLESYGGRFIDYQYLLYNGNEYVVYCQYNGKTYYTTVKTKGDLVDINACHDLICFILNKEVASQKLPTSKPTKVAVIDAINLGK